MVLLQQSQRPAGIIRFPPSQIASALPKVLTALRVAPLDKYAKFSDIARYGLTEARGHGDQQGISRRKDFPPRRSFTIKAAVFAVLPMPITMTMHNDPKRKRGHKFMADPAFPESAGWQLHLQNVRK